MKIGFFSGKFVGGGSKQGVIRPLAIALQSQGHEVFVLDILPWGAGQSDDDGLTIYTSPARLHMLRRPRLGLSIVSNRFRQSINKILNIPPQATTQPRPFDMLLGQIQNYFVNLFNLDVLYSSFLTNFPGLIAVNLPKELFIVVNFIGFGIDPKRGGFDCFPYQYYIFKNPFWDLHVAATDFEFTQYDQVYEAIGLSTDRLIHLPHCIDENLFHPLPQEIRLSLRRKHGFTEEQLILVYPVQVYPRKNIELAIDIMARLPRDNDTVLIITGHIQDQRYQDVLLQKVRRFGLANRVRFLNGVHRDDLMNIFNLANLTIFPSHQETFGLGIIESLACGTPVIGPAYIHPCREILNSSYGGIIANKDPNHFSEMIARTLDLDFDRERMARKTKEQFGNTLVAKKWLDRVQELRKEKLTNLESLSKIDWSDLYNDDLDLTNESIK